MENKALHDVEGKVLDALKKENSQLLIKLMIDFPEEFFTVLRSKSPIVQMPNCPVFVTRFDDVQEVLSRNDVFSVRQNQAKMDPSVGPSMLARDNTTINTRDKGLLQGILRQEDLPQLREIISRLAREAVREATKDERLEVVAGLSRRVPVQVLQEYFGFSGPDINTIIRWECTTYRDMFHNLDLSNKQFHEDNIQSGEEMSRYLKQLIAQRRTELTQGVKRNDILTRLLQTQLPSIIGFDDERIIANMKGFLVGGVEAPSRAIVQIIDQLLKRPEALEKLKRAVEINDDSTIFQGCWEALRFNPVSMLVTRVCESKYKIASGTTRATWITPGNLVFVCTRSAMHDELQVENPEEFRFDRPRYHYMHTGFGAHTCLGFRIAEIMVPEIIKQLIITGDISRLDGPEGKINFLDGPLVEKFTIKLVSRDRVLEKAIKY